MPVNNNVVELRTAGEATESKHRSRINLLTNHLVDPGHHGEDSAIADDRRIDSVLGQALGQDLP